MGPAPAPAPGAVHPGALSKLGRLRASLGPAPVGDVGGPRRVGGTGRAGGGRGCFPPPFPVPGLPVPIPWGGSGPRGLGRAWTPGGCLAPGEEQRGLSGAFGGRRDGGSDVGPPPPPAQPRGDLVAGFLPGFLPPAGGSAGGCSFPLAFLLPTGTPPRSLGAGSGVRDPRAQGAVPCRAVPGCGCVRRGALLCGAKHGTCAGSVPGATGGKWDRRSGKGNVRRAQCRAKGTDLAPGGASAASPDPCSLLPGTVPCPGKEGWEMWVHLGLHPELLGAVGWCWHIPGSPGPHHQPWSGGRWSRDRGQGAPTPGEGSL